MGIVRFFGILQTPCLNCNGSQVKGIGSIAKHLVRLSARPELLGEFSNSYYLKNWPAQILRIVTSEHFSQSGADQKPFLCVFLGKTAEEQALVNQWLEYRVTHVDRCASKLDINSVLKACRLPFTASCFAPKTDADAMCFLLVNLSSRVPLALQELNCHLSDQVYFVGHYLTLADLVMFYGLHCVLVSI